MKVYMIDDKTLSEWIKKYSAEDAEVKRVVEVIDNNGLKLFEGEVP